VPGEVEVEGIIRRSQSKSAIGGKADQLPGPGDPPLDAWYWINIPDISKQLPYELLPVYVAAQPALGGQQLPYRAETELDLSEGSHLGYALQWFTFAAILGIGYPFYVRRERKRQVSGSVESAEENPGANTQSKPNPEYQG
jgi:surfeit locus 1 family protein